MSTRPLVHVVDDDESLRRALIRLLETAGLETRGYASAAEFLLSPPPDRLGCLLLDVRMPGLSGLELQQAMQTWANPMPVVFLSGHADVPTSVRAMKLGAVDFLSKPATGEELLDAVGRAVERDRVARAERAEAQALRDRFATLSPREREILDLLASGWINREIAVKLEIGERTVKSDRAAIMEKLGADTPATLGLIVERIRRLSEDGSGED